MVERCAGSIIKKDLMDILDERKHILHTIICCIDLYISSFGLTLLLVTIFSIQLDLL